MTDDYKIEGSGGRGVATYTPWIAVFYRAETTTAQRGMYPVYLFAADMTTVTLSLNHGVTSVLNECRRRGQGRPVARLLLAQEARSIREALPDDAKAGLTTTLDLKSRGDLQIDYERGHVVGIVYSLQALPPEQLLRDDLARMLNLYMEALAVRERLREAGSQIVMPRPVVTTLSDDMPPTLRGVPNVGIQYRPVDEKASVPDRDPMSTDPAVIERGNRGHAKAQNMLAARLHELGYKPLRPTGDEPDYDLAWIVHDTLWVGEVKSLTPRNEERQLRLALGQVLRYSDLLSHRAQVSRVAIMGERKPTDPTWQRLCERLGVLLLWPDRLDNLAALIADD